jgi:hypothetical protein
MPESILKGDAETAYKSGVGRGDIQVQAQELFTMMQNDPGR